MVVVNNPWRKVAGELWDIYDRDKDLPQDEVEDEVEVELELEPAVKSVTINIKGKPTRIYAATYYAVNLLDRRFPHGFGYTPEQAIKRLRGLK